MGTNFKNGSPSAEVLLNISSETLAKWPILATFLGFSKPELDELTADNVGNFEQCYQILLKWTRKHGSKATYKSLATALENPCVELRDLAFQYCYRM